jgi:PmbA protein
MIKELFRMTENSTAFNITQSHIDSVRSKSITKSGCRVYDGGFIGVAGTMGEPDAATWAEAEKNLAYRVPYPFTPETGKRERDLRAGSFDGEVFLKQAEALLCALREEFPDFVFSNKILCSEIELTITNDLGLELIDRDRIYSFAIVIRAKESVSIFDTFLGGNYRTFDEKSVLADARAQLSVFRKPVPLPDAETLPVVIAPSEMLGKFTEALNGKLLGLGSSIFTDKVGKAVFSDSFSLLIDKRAENDPHCFFDAEGVQLPGDKQYLIENGVIQRGYADKDTARRYAVSVPGSAGGEYDDVPSLTYARLAIEPGEKTLLELTGSDKCVYIVVASGGDWTNDGDFASPVQLGYLLENGKLIGKLPEFGVSGNIYELFGKNYIGVSKDRPWSNEHFLITRMKISGQ